MHATDRIRLRARLGRRLLKRNCQATFHLHKTPRFVLSLLLAQTEQGEVGRENPNMGFKISLPLPLPTLV